MPSIELAGRAYFYEDRGEGVPLLLFHGFPFSSESWWPQLEAPFRGTRILAPDHRGFGKSAPGPMSIEAMAADGLALLDALKIERAIFGGCSMGGYVTIAAARLNPGRVAGLLLVDTQSTADDEAKKQSREEVAQQVEREGTAKLVESMLPGLVQPPARARVEAIMRAQAPQTVAAASRAMALRTDGKDLLSRYAGPCLIVVGEDDAMIPLAKSQVMHDLVSGSTLEVIPGAKHLPNLDAPQAFNDAVERWVARS